MKKALTISGMILLVALVAAGSFWGGMRYESTQAEQVRTSFANARGPGNGGPFLQGDQFPGGAIPSGVPAISGTMGQVKTVEGDVMTVSTAQDVSVVHLNDETQIWKSVTADIAELQPGMRVRVTGEGDEEGNITADQVTILSDEFTGDVFTGPADPSQAGTEP